MRIGNLCRVRRGARPAWNLKRIPAGSITGDAASSDTCALGPDESECGALMHRKGRGRFPSWQAPAPLDGRITPLRVGVDNKRGDFEYVKIRLV